MHIKVTHDIDDLASDMAAIPARAIRGGNKVVRTNIREGNKIGKAFAKESAGSHGKLYHLAWSSEMTGALQGEYGPDAAMPQGGMSFEGGSINQPPHLDAARSADIIGPKFAKDAGEMVDGLFW
jgi:hypothetical protein